MREVRVSSRYAKSILDLSIEKGTLEDVYKDMVLIKEACAESKDLMLLLKSPIIKSDKKEAILKEVFGSQVSQITLEFINIIIRKKREYLLEGVAINFEERYKAHKNILTATVTSAIPLPAATRDKVTKLVAETHSGDCELKEIVDPDIIGGLIITVGDRQIDESIKRKIADLDKEFSRNEYIKEI